MVKAKQTEELKSCPFCGGENVKIAYAHPDWMLKKLHNKCVFAGCPDCGITTKLYLVRKTGSPLLNKYEENMAMAKAAGAWNRRADNG